MSDVPFSQRLRAKPFPCLVEFTPRTAADVDKTGEFARKAVELNEKLKDLGFGIAGISITQNPAGRISYETGAAVGRLLGKGFPSELELIPHVTGKDMNVDAVRGLLRSLLEAGVTTLLALTGDKPISARGVFEVDSLGILDLVRQTNVERLRGARSDEKFRTVPLLEAAAAVSPFKYTEASWSMQLIKAEKKIRTGARFLICQAGWDSQKSAELMKILGPRKVPILGNVLVVDAAVARLMKNLPGCVVTDAFLETLNNEDYEGSLRRAAQQTAMFRSLGYAGAHLGNVEKIEDVESILRQAAEIKNWEEHKKNLDFAPEFEGPPKPPKKASRFVRALHDKVFEPEGAGYAMARTLLKPAEKSRVKGGGPMYHLFRMTETLAKNAMFECQLCGDCYLPEDQFVCTQSQCEKRLPNPPCGDSTVDGRCGNDPERPCAAEVIYARAQAAGQLDRLKADVRPPRLNPLRGTPSILNYFFGRSHGMEKSPLEDSGLIEVAELLHASIPAVGTAMRAMEELGEEGYTTPNRGYDVILDYIQSQAALKPAYLDVNIDELGGDTPTIMKRFMRLLREHANGVPPCVDSSNPEVLRAGLQAWFELDGKPPLVNSIPSHEIKKFESVLALRKDHKFSVVGMLVDENGPIRSADGMHAAAKEFYSVFREHGFEADEIFYDAVTLGITFDSCLDSMGEVQPSHTYNSFQAIKKIMNDPGMKGVHTILGVSNWPHGVKKRRIGHIRAFVHVAMAHGLDAAIVDVKHLFGVKPADPDLIGLVEMFASLDGSEDTFMTYQETVADARAKEWM